MTDAAITQACAAWGAIERVVGPLSGMPTEENALRMLDLLDRVREAAAQGLEGAASFERFLQEWVAAYEAREVDIPDADPVTLLKHLMQANGLRQADLAAEMGGQSVVSQVLRGQRDINLRQAKALGRRFGISAAAFLAVAAQAQEQVTSNEKAVLHIAEWQ